MSKLKYKFSSIYKITTLSTQEERLVNLVRGRECLLVYLYYKFIPGSLLSCISLFLLPHLSCPASLSPSSPAYFLSCLPSPYYPVSLLSWSLPFHVLPGFLFPVLNPYCPASFLSCLFHVLPPSCPASFLSCLLSVLPSSGPVFFLSCLIPVLPLSFPVSFVPCLLPVLL